MLRRSSRSRSTRSTLPSSSQATTTTRMPAITALAALVPCALDGIRQTSRCGSPRARWYAADRQQPGQLALRAGVGLHAHRVVPGHLGQPPLQLGDQLARSPAVCVGRRERVDVGELRPGHRLHLGGGVELHRARAERDHAAVQRVVPVGQPAQVAQHRRLGAVRVEHRVGQVVGGAAQRRRQRRRRRRPSASDVGTPNAAQHRAAGAPSVVVSSQAIADPVGVDQAQVDARARAAAATTSAARPGTDRGHRVEERVVRHLDAGGAQAGGERRRGHGCAAGRSPRSPSGPW